MSRAVRKKLVITSAMAYAGAFLITTILHELAHFVVALLWDRAPTLFHNAVHSSSDASTVAKVTGSLAGPLFSLVQGLAFVLLERRLRRADPVLRLMLVWLAFHGLMNATGYLFTTAFVPDADMGSAARALGIPTLGLIVCSGLGFWSIRLGARLIYPGFVALLPVDARSQVLARNRGLIQLSLFAWPLGVLLVLPSSLPVPHWISLFYVVIAGVGAVWFTDFSKAELEGAPVPVGDALADRLAWWPWVVWLAVTALCVGVLRHGVTL